MLPFECIVDGPPVSQQTRTSASLRSWRDRVRAAARLKWPPGLPPVTVAVQFTVVYYHEGADIRMDNDNLVKPIQDALNELVYADDRQITDTRVRKTNIDRPIRARGISPVLAEGFVRGREFLHIRVEVAPKHEEPL